MTMDVSNNAFGRGGGKKTQLPSFKVFSWLFEEEKTKIFVFFFNEWETCETASSFVVSNVKQYLLSLLSFSVSSPRIG